MADNKSPVTITGSQTTSGAAEETLLISENGGPSVAFRLVAPGTTLVISDFDVSALGALAIFKIEQNSGAGFFPIASVTIPGLSFAASENVSPRTAWVLNGPAAFRIRVATPGGALPVASTLSGYRES